MNSLNRIFSGSFTVTLPLVLIISAVFLGTAHSASFKIGVAVTPKTDQLKIEREINDIERDFYDGAALAVKEFGQNHTITLSIPNFDTSIEKKIERLDNERSVAASVVYALPRDSQRLSKAISKASHPVLVSGTSVSPRFNSRNYFQLSPTVPLQIEAMINHARRNRFSDRLTVMVLDNSEPYISEEIAAVFRQMNIVSNVIFVQNRIKRLDQKRMKVRVVNLIKKANPSAVFLLGGIDDSLNTIADLREINVHCPVYLRLKNATNKVKNRLYQKGEIYAVTAASHKNSLPGEPGFVNRFARQFGRDPSSWAALSYDGVKQIIRAVDSGYRNNLRSDVSDTLSSLPVDFGAGFALDFSKKTQWYPAISKLERGNFIVKDLPGRSALTIDTNQYQASAPRQPRPATGRTSSYRSNSNSINYSNTSQNSTYISNTSRNSSYPRNSSPSPRYNSRRSGSQDLTETGVVRQWRHFLVLPE